MSRSEKSDIKINELGAKPVRCDLESVSAIDIGEADIVLHCAAYVEAWGPKEAWYKTNVIGTETMLNVAKSAGVKRFIHIGTEAAIVKGQDIINADETVSLAPGSPYPYCSTKAQAEQKVKSANQNGEFETITLRPRFVWGPGDTTLMPIIKAMAATGKCTWINNGKAMTSSTHIDNLVHAIELALHEGEAGEAYFIIDEGNVSMKNMISSMAQSQNLTLGDKSIPSWLAGVMALLTEGIWRLFRLKGEPPITRHAAMVMSRECTLKGDKAAAELGYRPVISRSDGFAMMKNA